MNDIDRRADILVSFNTPWYLCIKAYPDRRKGGLFVGVKICSSEDGKRTGLDYSESRNMPGAQAALAIVTAHTSLAKVVFLAKL
jgi:hypothetical protein